MTYEEWAEAHDLLDRLTVLGLPSRAVENLRIWLPMSAPAPWYEDMKPHARYL